MSERRLVFAMDIGGTRTKTGLVDLSSHKLIIQQVAPTETGGLEAFARAAGQAARELCQQAGLDLGEIRRAGVGVPGYVDGDQVSQVWETLAFMEGSALRPALEAELGFPVRMDNDGRAVAMGEAYFGGHNAPRRLLSLTLGTGLGVALVVDGQLLEKNSISHLAGHIPIRLEAAPCFCGFSGCLESLVCGPALVRNFIQACEQQGIVMRANVDARQVFEFVQAGHPASAPALQQLLEDLTVGLNALIYIYGPDLIVLGGGMAFSLGPWLAQIQKGLFASPFAGYQVSLSLSTLGEQAGLLGAASL